ncbi:unnamed protein product, partial [Rotaria magnacalcarata]
MPTVKSRRAICPKEQLTNVIDAVKSGQMTSVKASEVYGVPQSTIRSILK